MASWDYFEAGHGKSACDGIGAVAKCSAAQAIKQRKIEIQDANDFYRWAVSQDSVIHYVMYTPTEYQAAQDEIKAMGSLKAVRGTFKIHAVRCKSTGGLFINNSTCYNPQCCLTDIGPQCGWTEASVSSP